VESWFGAEEGTDPAIENEWPLLPFMALSDGAHVYADSRLGRERLPYLIPTDHFVFYK
jgi:hypothetical protein